MSTTQRANSIGYWNLPKQTKYMQPTTHTWIEDYSKKFKWENESIIGHNQLNKMNQYKCMKVNFLHPSIKGPLITS